MKKICLYFGMLLWLLLSCSSDDGPESMVNSYPNSSDPAPTEALLLKKIKYSDGSTIGFEYSSDKKLSRMVYDEGARYLIFIYNGNLISQINCYLADGAVLYYVENFYYENESLSRYTARWLDSEHVFSSETHFTYFSGGKVGLNTVENYGEEGYYYDENLYYYEGNIVQLKNEEGETFSYTYDAMSSAWTNIEGFIKIGHNFHFGDYLQVNANNILNRVEQQFSNQPEKVVKYSYQYNAQGYPTLVSISRDNYPLSTILFTYY